MSLVLEKQPLPLRTDDDGVIRVGNTRVTLETVIGAFRNGATPEQIAQDYTTLDLVEIYDVIAFYLYQRAAVDAYLVEQSEEGKKIRAQMEARFDPHGIRDRLLARRAPKEQDGGSVTGG